jgi:hypothetical protein
MALFDGMSVGAEVQMLEYFSTGSAEYAAPNTPPMQPIILSTFLQSFSITAASFPDTKKSTLGRRIFLCDCRSESGYFRQAKQAKNNLQGPSSGV